MAFTHLTEDGRVQMVDVSEKPVTRRNAVAGGEVRCRPETVKKMLAKDIKKGDVFAAARIAGIMAAKKTPELIPLCHTVSIDAVDIDISADPKSGIVAVKATAASKGKTGIEMEALTAVSGACLCVYDMCKAIDKDMVIGNIRLLRKSGGRSGDYVREE